MMTAQEIKDFANKNPDKILYYCYVSFDDGSFLFGDGFFGQHQELAHIGIEKEHKPVSAGHVRIIKSIGMCLEGYSSSLRLYQANNDDEQISKLIDLPLCDIDDLTFKFS